MQMHNDLLYKVQPTVVDVILGEGRHRLRSLSQRQVAVVGLTYHIIVQLLWRIVVILNLDMNHQDFVISDFM